MQYGFQQELTDRTLSIDDPTINTAEDGTIKMCAGIAQCGEAHSETIHIAISTSTEQKKSPRLRRLPVSIECGR
jgi:hypothetical protein